MHQPTQETTVSVNSDLQSVPDIQGIPLSVPGNANKMLYVGDIAHVEDSHVEMRSISTFNAKPRVYISLGRNIESDELKSTQIARAEIKKIQEQFPELQFTETDAPAESQNLAYYCWRRPCTALTLPRLT